MAFGTTFHSDPGFILRFEHDCYKYKKEKGNNKATVVPKNQTDRERDKEKGRGRKRDSKREFDRQTDELLHITFKNIVEKINLKERAAKLQDEG